MGIIFATFLTLVVVPTMYSVVDDLALWFRHHYLAAPDSATRIAVATTHGGDARGFGPEDEPPSPPPSSRPEESEAAVPALRRSRSDRRPPPEWGPGGAGSRPSTT
ncbi:MAG: hypothetical protein EA422_02745 [Gemmatimonadales bacterium]|nr:MAG: hypothetical protein EA422_02745 [Gemmatimonadales bacterium]